MGNVTFSATDCTVPVSKDFVTVRSGNLTFMPAFAQVANTGSQYALNVVNGLVNYTGDAAPGSRFERGLRNINPFEAYLQANGAAVKQHIGISFAPEATGIIPMAGEAHEQGIYSVSGQQIARPDDHHLEQRLRGLAKGVYIVNGKKIFVK